MKIKSIKKVQCKNTHYDIQVEKNHNFFANDILTHNCNLPARNVVIVGTTRGINPVDELDIIQEAGRAGRYRLDDQGDCYLICNETEKWKYTVAHPRLIKSTLLDIRILGFHILAGINDGSIFNKESLIVWYQQSLAYIQNSNVSLDAYITNVVIKLSRMGMIEVDQERYLIKPLGTISAELYYFPEDIFWWHQMFSTINECDLWDDDLAVSWALGSAPSFQLGYVPKKDIERVGRYITAIHKLGFFKRECVFSSVIACDLYDLIIGYSNSFSLKTLQLDIKRITTALKFIDRNVNNWNKTAFFDVLALRVRYGVEKHLVDLISIPGIGIIRANKLYNAGIKRLKDISKRGNKKLLKRLLGSVTTEKLLDTVSKSNF